MGGQLSRAQRAVANVAASSTKSSPASAAPPGSQRSEAPRPVPITPPPLLASAPPVRASGDEWAKLLNDIGGTITSKTWEGTVGVRVASAGERGSSVHAAQQSRAMRAKLPKRQPGPRPAAPGPDSEQGVLAELSAALDGGASVKAAARRGRLNQNQVLDLFRRRREEPGRWEAPQVATRYALVEEDARNLLQYSRTVLADEGHGIARGVADPDRGILRFEDVNQE
jgi:Uncharacterised protein family (UPF0240)